MKWSHAHSSSHERSSFSENLHVHPGVVSINADWCRRLEILVTVTESFDARLNADQTQCPIALESQMLACVSGLFFVLVF